MQKALAKKQTISFLGKTIVIGPGAMATSPGSPQKTDMDKVARHARRCSELGVFDKMPHSTKPCQCSCENCSKGNMV